MTGRISGNNFLQPRLLKPGTKIPVESTNELLSIAVSGKSI